MRTKSDEKKRQIVRVAAKAFEELGYERTSMLAIAERMRGSKQTLYNYFPSKEDLLRAVLGAGVGETADDSLAQFMADSAKDVRKALVRVGVAYLEHQLSPSTIALVRTAANLPAESRMGAEFYEEALRPAWRRFAECLESLMTAGKLKRADPWLASLQFKALAQLDLYERHLLGAASAPDPREIERTAKSAADAFLKIYGAGAESPQRRP
jgi:AcrR family transcriptional regulator